MRYFWMELKFTRGSLLKNTTLLSFHLSQSYFFIFYMRPHVPLRDKEDDDDIFLFKQYLISTFAL